MSNIKKYLQTALVLGSIAGVAAGLIALTNFISKDRIIQNEQNKVEKGIQNIFGENAKIDSEEDLSGHTYTVHLYEVKDNNDAFLGYAFRSDGSNMYGKISLISGFDANSHSFVSLYMIKNEQTYATTLVDNYISPLNEGERNLEDVSCGATYGAKLIRDMINEASEVANSLW